MLRLSCLALLVFVIAGCSNPVANRTPINESFPQVAGENLNRQQVVLPKELEGDLRLLLVGYVQDSQFDIDRWLIGLDMTQTKVTAYEIPTIKGMFPRMFEGFINNGMRKGIPKQLWGGVITVYDEAEKITALTGTENPNNARVLLLNEQGTILYFYDSGFAVDALNDLRDVIDSTRAAKIAQNQ
ncbi:hypothetical protein ACFSJY_07545 [Thalassotalea euphylliae]|uniref:hypothetical protein n=1 Tax=Thalassotalea euphylliae TaxID=1655234 RepID=UPI003634F5D4